MFRPIKIYLVWYGSRWQENQKQLVRTFISSLGSDSLKQVRGSLAQWWNTAQLYYDKQGNHVSGNITLGVFCVHPTFFLLICHHGS